MKKVKLKQKNYKLFYPLIIIGFYALGILVCSVRFSPRILEGNFFFGIDQLNFLDFCKGWLYHLIPYLIIFFSGYDFLGSFHTTVVLAVRSLYSGYSGSACVVAYFSDGTILGILIFVLFVFVESMILILLLSCAIEQDKFRSYYIINSKSPFKSGVNVIYVNHNIQRCGILILLYLFRSCVCYLM